MRNEQEEKRGELLNLKLAKLKKQPDDFKNLAEIAEMNAIDHNFNISAKERDVVENEETADIWLECKEVQGRSSKEPDSGSDELLKYLDYQKLFGFHILRYR